MVNEQLGLIQRQRAANFEQRLAQEQKNREFREEQLQNIYDFDVSGLASGDAKLLKQLQTELANSLDPNSENSYSSSRELVSDIAFINNVYGEMKRWGQTGGAGRQSYQQSILNPDRGDGTVFTGNEELLDKRNATWEQGAFASAEILGEAGNRQIIGNVLDQDGNVMQEGVDFFENVWRNRPDEFWRPEIAQGALLLDGVALDYAGRSGVDNTNVDNFAGAVFDSDPNIYDRVVRERLIAINQDRASQNLPAITIEDTADLESYSLSEKDIRAEYIAKAKEGVGLRPTKAAPQTFSGSVYDTQFGVRAAGLAKPISVTSSTLSGDVSHVGLVGDQMVVVYEDADGEIQQARVSEGSDAWDSIVAQSGGFDALSDMVRGQQILPREVEGEPKVDETLEGRQKALEEEVSNLEASKIELERRLEDAQDALSLAQNTRSGSQVQQAQINAALNEVKTLSEQLDQVNADIQRKAQIGPDIPEEYKSPAAIKGEGENISYKKPSRADAGKLIVGDKSQGSTYDQRKASFEEASKLAKEAGHPFPEVVAAQFALESAYGKKPTGDYNFFGLKASNAMLERLRSAGIDASVAKDIQTTEQDKTGKEKNIKADFLSFKSPEDAFMAYLMFIDTTKSDGKRRYGEALDQAKTAKEYLQKIKESGYATAKDYVSSIDSIASGFGVDLGNISRDDDRLASN
jgi:flagellum-specific peptidoglycan hydrolase FlgJ